MGKKDAREKGLAFYETFGLSGAAAVISKTAAAPIERVKLLVQNQDEMLKSGRLKTPYKGVMDCTSRVLAEEGVGPFWRGNLANCLRYFPTQALNFAFKDKVKAALKPNKKVDSGVTILAKNVASGGIAGSMSLTFVYSLDYARTRLAADAKGKGGERQFNGLLDVYKKTIASDGIAGVYRGFPISCVGIFIYRGCYFGFYDTAKGMMDAAAMPKSFARDFLLGWGVTVTAGLASYPIDTIRRRMMMTSGEGVKYKNAMDCGATIVKSEGVASLFKGAGANVLRGVAGAGVLAGFDVVKGMYLDYKFGEVEPTAK